MGLGQYISNTVLLDLWQLCEIDEKQYNMGPLKQVPIYSVVQENASTLFFCETPEMFCGLSILE